MNLRDAELKETKALPDGAASTSTDAFDLGALSGLAGQATLAECELLISAPALTTTEAPDTKTFTYKVECDADSAFGSPRVIANSVIIQTGAGGAGAAAATARVRLPTNCERYVRVTCTGVATCAGSTATMTAELLF